jgi:hypothetical protein
MVFEVIFTVCDNFRAFRGVSGGDLIEGTSLKVENCWGKKEAEESGRKAEISCQRRNPALVRYFLIGWFVKDISYAA